MYQNFELLVQCCGLLKFLVWLGRWDDALLRKAVSLRRSVISRKRFITLTILGTRTLGSRPTSKRNELPPSFAWDQFIVAREMGFEPMTFRLTAERSTTELLPNDFENHPSDNLVFAGVS